MERAGGVALSAVEIVTVLQPHRADDAVPAHSGADGRQDFIERVLVHTGGDSDHVREKDRRPVLCHRQQVLHGFLHKFLTSRKNSDKELDYSESEVFA